MSFINDYVEKYPSFMRRDKESNNYKFHTITGNYLKDLKQVLSNLRWDKEIIKPIQIYKEQIEEYKYKIVFKINVPIEEITFMEDEKEIKIPESQEDNVYTYTSTSSEIIPIHKYACKVKTPNDEIWAHGIPENNIKQNDIYDHDESLDKIGKLLNIPRQKFREVEPKDYNKTKPPYNNLSIEADYEYSMRLYEFCENMETKALPLLYLKAWLNIDAELSNREKYLCKMAPGDMYGVLPLNDNPLSFEHRDRMCQGLDEKDFLFIYTVNTYNPLANTILEFNFKLMNSLWEEHALKGAVVPYIDGNNKELGILSNNYNWSIVSNKLGAEEYLVRFKYFETESLAKEELSIYDGKFIKKGLYTEDELFKTISFSNANKYVNTKGSDDQKGTREKPYQTIRKGVKEIQNNETLGVQGGTYEFNDNIVMVDKNICIVGANTPIIHTKDNIYYFVIKPYNRMLLEGITFSANQKTTLYNNTVFENNGRVDISLVGRRKNTEKIYPLE